MRNSTGPIENYCGWSETGYTTAHGAPPDYPKHSLHLRGTGPQDDGMLFPFSDKCSSNNSQAGQQHPGVDDSQPLEDSSPASPGMLWIHCVHLKLPMATEPPIPWVPQGYQAWEEHRSRASYRPTHSPDLDIVCHSIINAGFNPGNACPTTQWNHATWNTMDHKGSSSPSPKEINGALASDGQSCTNE